ncbi:MAG: acyl-CoA reductase [Myxococcota bacterium]
MSGLEIRWPDESGERVRAARGRLEAARPALANWAFEDRLDMVARVVDDWTRADSPWRRELALSFAETSPFSPGTVAEGLDAALRAWDPATLVECARRELAPVLEEGTRRLAPFDCTAILAGGALPMPTLLSALLPLILGSPVLLRESSKDSVTAAALARSLAARDERLASAFAFLDFPASDEVALSAFLDAPCVVATGSDETLKAVGSRLNERQRFVGYGHRFSIGIVGSDQCEKTDSLESIARGFALDTARWDQSGCLSPVVIYLVGLPLLEQARFAAACSEALEALAAEMPIGNRIASAEASTATERAEAEMRAASGRGAIYSGATSTVVLEHDAQPRPAPLGRFLRLMPVTDLTELDRTLRPFDGTLSNAAVAGLNPEHRRELDCLMTRFGVSRITEPGRLQTPPIDWPHDGMPLLVPFSRFVQYD